jgi:D-cysteine desulfhydrase
MDLSRFPRRRYTQGATPLEPMPNFSRALGGPEIWVKRDDMLGLAPGGNKTRKLEFLVADALEKGADTLVTCGAPQSNHCRITLAAAVKEGLKCRFVIEERVPGSFSEQASGNHFMFRLMGVESIEARLHHPGRRLQCTGRSGLCVLRAGVAAAMVRPGPAF